MKFSSLLVANTVQACYIQNKIKHNKTPTLYFPSNAPNAKKM